MIEQVSRKLNISNPGLSNPFPEHSLQNCPQKVWMSSLLMIIFVLSILLQESYCEWISWHTNINILVEFFDMCCSVYSKAAWLLLLLAGYGQEYLPIPIVDIPDWTCQTQEKGKGRRREKMLGRHFIWLKEDLEVEKILLMMVTAK